MTRVSRSTLAIIVVSGIFICGCSENPKTKAAKEARAKAQSAIEKIEIYNLGDDSIYESARKEVQEAFLLASQAGEGVDLVYIAGGDLARAHGAKLSEKIDSYQKAVIDAFDAMGKEMYTLTKLDKELEVQKFLADASQKELDKLQGIIAGDQEQGLVDKLTENQKKLDDLFFQLGQFQAMADKAKENSDDLQNRADQLLREAQNKEGEARIAMERNAYRLLMGYDSDGNRVAGKSDYDFRLQEALDQIEIIKSKIAIIKPLVEKISSDLNEIRSRVTQLDAQDLKHEHLKFVAALEGLISDSKDKLTALNQQLNGSYDAYVEYLNEVLKEYDSALGNYAKVRSREYKGMAGYETASVLCVQAKLSDQAYDFAARLNDYSDKYLELGEDGVVEALGAFRAGLESRMENLIETSQDKYAQGFEKFDSVVASGSNKELADTAVRKYMLLIAQRIKQAEKLGDDETKDAMLAKVEEIKEIAIMSDPYFSRSIVAQAFSAYNIEFKTEQEKLIEQYELLSQDFDACQQLEGSDRTEQLTSLVEQLYELDKPQDMRIYTNLVKKAFDSFRTDWISIKKANPDMTALEVFAEMMPQIEETQEAPALESGETYDMFGESPEDSNSF